MPKSAARQALITCSGTPGLWATKTGGNPTSDITRVWDGGQLDPDILTAPASYSDLTISRPYEQGRDEAMVARLRSVVGRSNHSVTVQSTDINLVAVGRASTFHGVLTGVSAPDWDAGSSDPARVELTIAVRTVT